MNAALLTNGYILVHYKKRKCLSDCKDCWINIK